MRSLLVGMALVAVTAPAWAQVPAGPIPATATAQQTEPGRYWVFFAHNRASLQPDAEQVVAEAAQSFLRTGSTRISLVGSADSTGAAAYNQKLSERRAETVRAELVRLGVPAETITVRAEGENAPIVPTPRGVPEARNRYVAIDFPEREAPPPVAAATPEPPPPPPPAPPEPPRFSAQLGGFSGYNLKENDSGNTNTNHLLGLQLTLGYLATPNLELNLSQAGFHSLDGNDDGWGGRSTAGIDLRANYGALHPYIGANLGGIYGKGVQDGPLVGPEIGLKYDISDSTYFHVQTGYDYGFRNPWDKGIVQGGLGLGVRF